MIGMFGCRLRYAAVMAVFFIACYMVILVSSCSADENAIIKELEALKTRITVLESDLANQRQKTEQAEQMIAHVEPIVDIFDGFAMSAGATFVMQATNNANGDNQLSDGDDVIDASYSIDLGIEKAFDDYGLAFIHLEAGGGNGVEDELTVFSNVNRDADNDENVRLTEAWYEHYCKGVPLTLTAGKIDATGYIDTNEYANDEAAQFLGRIFRNAPTIEFADNGAGARFALEPVDFLDIELVAMDADSDWEDVFDEMFVATQLNFKPKVLGKDGNYRFIAWRNDQDHTRWLKQSQVTESNYGFGISFDQELADALGVFLRYGWQNPKVFLNEEAFSLEHTWSTGIQVSGSLWDRGNDVLGLAIGQALPSHEYKKSGTALNAHAETHLETYYCYQVNDHLALSPDIHIIWNPYGDDASIGDDAIVVFGMRGQVDF